MSDFRVTVYAVYEDMETEFPEAFVLSEQMAKRLIAGYPHGNIVKFEIVSEQWLALLQSNEKEEQR